ncbi:uncharacterized protein ACB058_001927 isoform 1-T3 [Synchiropus picturatus]
MNYIPTEDDNYESDEWFESCEDYYDCDGLANSESTTRQFGSFYTSPLRCITELKESDAERKGRLLQEEKQNKDKAEKKRIKKKRQKERKQRDKAEKEKLMFAKQDEDGLQEPVAKENATKDACEEQSDLSTDETDRGAHGATPAKDTNVDQCESSSEGDNPGDTEELDFSSTFVSKAAEIVKRKLDQKLTKPDQREKKSQSKCQNLPDKPKDDTKEDSEAHINSTLEENVKRSNELALIGNQYANIGDFKMAVKFFTDAVKYNPTEFKLFGNRSFCYEKLQDYERALADAELCLSISPRWVKGLFRKGRALAGLKRYAAASQAFREVLKLDMKCTEAAQELMHVQIIQLMEYGYTREQSTNALIIHGMFDKALEALSQLKQHPKVSSGILPRPQVINATGTSPVLSANPALPPPHTQEASAQSARSKPAKSQPSPIPPSIKTNSSESNPAPPKELFPVWVGNVMSPMTEFTITNLFESVGKVHSVKMLSTRRCAFVNFTNPEDCDEAIRRFHGSMLKGIKLAVRYPDRFPQGMGISKSALKAPSVSEEHVEYPAGGVQFRRSCNANGPDAKAYKQT